MQTTITMKIRLFLAVPIFILLVSPFMSLSVSAKQAANHDPIKVLLLTGQSNKYHSWQATSQALNSHLNNAGIFHVETITLSRAPKELNAFNPTWANYDVVVLDYEGEEWSKATKKSFERYIKKGGGLVVVHATDNSFPNWPAFNEMIGIGGWGGANLHAPPLPPVDGQEAKNRNEHSGPRVYWQNGKAVKDTSAGHASHPPRHDYIITIRDHAHPITQGLPEKWLNLQDELYSGLRGPAKNLTVLATGFANPSYPYVSPHEEPVLFTVRYGKGRIFHSTLGHAGAYEKADAISLNNVSFITTLQRGTEWAATGNVTQPVPDDFANVYEGSARQTNTKAWKTLLDKDLTGWDAYVGVPEPSVVLPSTIELAKGEAIGLRDPKNIFSTYKNGDQLILHITGEIYAGLTSKQEFENYHLQMKMRWGDKKWAPRLDKKRDSGILYHAHGEHGAFWDVWKSSLEYQVQESDIGDFISLAGPTVQARQSKQEKRVVYDTNQPFKAWDGYLHAQTEVDRPHGAWNTLDLYVIGGSAIHVVNGKVVMAIKDAMDKHGKPLLKGQLQIQSEAAEVEYTDIKIRNIEAFPPLLARKAKLSDK